MGVLRNMWKIMKAQEWQGDPKQNGGVLILGPGNNISSNVFLISQHPSHTLRRI